ncbi:16S rRNA (cytosine(967)-C(5))-methyltransferase RsmB [Haliea sp. E17]|uniref:16S rRNA (cytosine(967)-C(5))-methyltransferase RsmB n=1 Tax=Haliea sp. E17 TaxID=3401576 RepID=UPI003AAA8BF1
MATNPRATAAQVLGQVLAGRSLNQALPPALARVALADRPLLQQLCYGSLRSAPTLLGLLDQLLDKPLRERDRDVQGLLLCGLYQLEDTRIPDHAAVAETVAAAARLKKPWAKGLTNALLRRFLRERETLFARLSPAQQAAQPEWLYRELQKQWPGQLQQIIDASNQRPPMTLRSNQLRGDRDSYLQQLAAAGIGCRAGSFSPQAIYLDQPVDVMDLPGFASGAVSVQDEAAQLAAPVVAPRAGERILDACAAPGGKSCHLLEIQPAIASLVAMDVDASRLQRVEENLQRLQLRATCVAGDASAPAAVAEFAPFDCILVDAPCSATGVIRRHPDIKVLRRREDIAALGQLQRAILEGLWPLLRGGGRLVYATCSILPAENDDVVAAFAAATSDAALEPIAAQWGIATTTGRQLLPETGGPDGLFYAVLRKA